MKRQIPIGKKVRSAIYVHRDYTHMVFPDEIWDKTLNCFYDGHYYTQWDIAKWDSRKDTLSFIFCNDFDVDPEPSIRFVITLHLGTMKRTSRATSMTAVARALIMKTGFQLHTPSVV